MPPPLTLVAAELVSLLFHSEWAEESSDEASDDETECDEAECLNGER
jgi:hypothetical protein